MEVLHALAWLCPLFFFSGMILMFFFILGTAPSFREGKVRK